MDLSDSSNLPSEVSETLLQVSEADEEISSQASTRANTTALSYKQRCQIQALRLFGGWTCSKIANTLELSLPTVWRICQSPPTLVKRKNKIKITTPLHKRLVFEATKNAASRRKPYHEIASSIGLNVSVNSLRRAFEKEGYHRRAAQKKPFLSQLQKTNWLEFAQSKLEWDEEDWYNIFWTDECYIWMGELRGTVHVTRIKDESFHEDCLLPHFVKKDSFMIWGGILESTEERFLIIWDKKNWGSIKATAYINHILEPVVKPFLHHQYEQILSRQTLSSWIIFMDDTAPAHRAKITQEFKKKNFFRILNWSSNSPDLNPIENIWNLLKNRLQAREPRPQEIEEIKKAVVEEWNAIIIEEIRKYVDSMPKRIQEVISSNGGHTRW